jgi:hypothetical protein
MAAADGCGEESRRMWTRLRCGRRACRYTREQPGPVRPGDLDVPCRLCGAELGAVSVYAVTPRLR